MSRDIGEGMCLDNNLFILMCCSEQYVLMNNYELAYKYSDQLNML